MGFIADYASNGSYINGMYLIVEPIRPLIMETTYIFDAGLYQPTNLIQYSWGTSGPIHIYDMKTMTEVFFLEDAAGASWDRVDGFTIYHDANPLPYIETWTYDYDEGGILFETSHVIEENYDFKQILFNPVALFTDTADTVNFNSLTSTQLAAINAIKKAKSWDKLYNALDGSDVITLPGKSPIPGTKVEWAPPKGWFYGNGGNDTITGGALNDKISGGAGDDVLDGKGGSNTFLGVGSVNDLGETESGDNTIRSTGGTSRILYHSIKEAYDLTAFSFWDVLKDPYAPAYFVKVSPILGTVGEDKIYGSKSNVSFVFAGKEYAGSEIATAAAINYVTNLVEDLLAYSAVLVGLTPGGQPLAAGTLAVLAVWDVFKRTMLTINAEDKTREAFVQTVSLPFDALVDKITTFVTESPGSAPPPFVNEVFAAADKLRALVHLGMGTLWDTFSSDTQQYFDPAQPNTIPTKFNQEVEQQFDQILHDYRQYIEDNGLQLKEETPSPFLSGFTAPTFIDHTGDTPINVDLASLSISGTAIWLSGTKFDDVIVAAQGKDLVAWGGGGADKITGKDGADIIYGGEGADDLTGGDNDDILVGGLGKDLLTGGTGADRFVFQTKADSLKGVMRDVITDFARNDGDVIDLTGIDASAKKAGDQAFKFIGKQDFHKKAGELHYLKKGGSVIVQGDVTGNGKADFEIFVSVASLAKGDFLL
ncbi:MAG: hypothetical protein R3D30_10950 [Hyphomicrobiales bacterium]